PEVVERHVRRDERRALQRVVAVECGRDRVHDREERYDDRDDPNRVPPPGVFQPRPLAGLRDLRASDRDRGDLNLLARAHARFSNAFVRKRAMPAMIARRKKMMIETALARA